MILSRLTSLIFATLALAASISLTSITLANSSSNKDSTNESGGLSTRDAVGAYDNRGRQDIFNQRSVNAKGSAAWVALGPFGGARLAAIDLRNNAVMLASSDVGVFRTEDSGGTWALTSSGIPPNNWINDIHIDLLDSARLLAAGQSRIYLSSDSGLSWEAMLERRGATEILPHPFDENTLLAINPPRRPIPFDDILWKSTDRGASWTRVDTGFDDNFLRTGAYDPSDPNVIYVGSYGPGIFRSNDGGDSWSIVLQGLDGYADLSITPDKSLGGRVYVGTEIGIYVSDDYGISWDELNSELRESEVRDIKVHPDNSDRIFAVDNQPGLLRSLDSGASWARIITGLEELSIGLDTDGGPAESLIIGPDSSLFISTTNGILKGNDLGENWNRISDGLRAVSLSAIEVTRNGNIVAASRDNFYSRSEGATSWNTTYVPENVWTSEIFVSERNEDEILVQTVFTLSRSYDGGSTWTPLVVPQFQDIPSSAAHNRRKSEIFVTDWDGAVVRSLDFGDTWELISQSPRILNLIIDQESPNIMYGAALDDEIFKSEDNGRTWGVLTDQAGRFPEIAAGFWPNDLVYYSSSGDLHISDDGVTWREVSPNGYVSSFAIHPYMPERIFATAGGVAYWTRDRGETWNILTSDLGPIVSPAELKFERPWNALYLVDGGRGVFKYEFTPSIETEVTIQSVSPAGAVVGEPYFVEVSVAAGASQPDGLVEISDGLSYCLARVESGSGDCQLRSPSSGMKDLRARFFGDRELLPSLSEEVGFNVEKAQTYLRVIDHTPNPSKQGRPIDVLVEIGAVSPGGGTIDGPIMVAAGETSCQIVLPTRSCQLSLNEIGQYDIRATYAGSSDYHPSTAEAVSHRVVERLVLFVDGFEARDGEDSLGAIRHWPIEESSGSFTEEVIAGNHGHLSAFSGFIADPSPSGGAFAIYSPRPFIGSRGVSVTHSAAESFDLDSASFSIALWVKSDEGGGWPLLKLSDSTTGGWYGFEIHDSLTRFEINIGGLGQSTIRAEGPPITGGRYHHLAGTYASGAQEIKLFIDGELSSTVSTGGLSGVLGNDPQPLIFLFNVEGTVDDIYVFDRALTHAEIRDLSVY